MVKIKCPQCQKKITYSKDNPHRPFCSQRCKSIDLGAWASESYAIPTQENNPHLADEIDSYDNI